MLGRLSRRCDLSLVVGYYRMQRELPRTLATLARSYQAGAAQLTYEILIVDNGSPDELPAAAWSDTGCPVRYLKHPGAGVSPVRALNDALRQARGRMVALMIDGARMLSPGIFRGAMRAAALSPRAVVGVHGFHLGPDLQSRSILSGYCQAEEDRLLASVPWQSDGYRLLDISVFAGSSHRGWFINPTESNCLVMPRELWAELHYLEERFETPGGGLVNLDIYKRASEAPDVERFLLLGEGTFHQYHGGAATGQPATTANPNEPFDAEYERIRGEKYRVPTYSATLLGEVSGPAKKYIVESARQLRENDESPNAE